MDKKKLLFMPAILLLAALACNAPAAQNSAADGSAATITALAATIQAQNATGITATPAAAPQNADTATTTLTPTPSVPMVTVSQATNCRGGPGSGYDMLGALNPGQTAVVVGKYTAGNYWIINNLTGSGTCWLWGQYATVSGNTTGLPEMTPPPTPTPKFTATPKDSPTPKNSATPKPTATQALPKAPTNLAESRTCGGGYRGVTPIWIEAVTLTWQNSANNQTGFYVYKDGTQLPAISPGATSYSITLRYDQGTGGALYDTFGIEAFNATGSSPRAVIDVPTCP